MSSETPQLVPWKNLGNSGLKISNIIVGFMSFGSKNWEDWLIEDKTEIFKILKAGYDKGIRTYDTADVYSNGLSERILGEFLREYKIKRDKVVILTKVFFPTDEGEYPVGYPGHTLDVIGSEVDKMNFINNRGLSRKHIIDAVKNSVERLGTYIDVYQIHRYDHTTPPEETMKALNDVIEEGYTRYIGASSMKAVEFAELQHIADKNGWHKFISMQSFYNLLNRGDEDEMNFFCDKTGVGLIPWSPLATGALARPVPKSKSEFTDRSQTTNFNEMLGVGFTSEDKERAVDIEIINRVEKVAEQKKVSMAAVATAWVISKGAAPIIGFSSVKRIEDSVVGANLKLTEEEIKYLEEPYQPKKRVY